MYQCGAFRLATYRSSGRTFHSTGVCTYTHSISSGDVTKQELWGRKRGEKMRPTNASTRISFFYTLQHKINIWDREARGIYKSRESISYHNAALIIFLKYSAFWHKTTFFCCLILVFNPYQKCVLVSQVLTVHWQRPNFDAYRFQLHQWFCVLFAVILS